MTEKTLIKTIKKIVYEHNASSKLINEVLMTYRISNQEMGANEDEILILCAADTFNIDPLNILSRSQRRECVYSRQMIWLFLKRKYPLMTYKALANVMNRQDHANVIHGINSMSNLLEFDKDAKLKWSKFTELVSHRLD